MFILKYKIDCITPFQNASIAHLCFQNEIQSSQHITQNFSWSGPNLTFPTSATLPFFPGSLIFVTLTPVLYHDSSVHFSIMLPLSGTFFLSFPPLPTATHLFIFLSWTSPIIHERSNQPLFILGNIPFPLLSFSSDMNRSPSPQHCVKVYCSTFF